MLNSYQSKGTEHSLLVSPIDHEWQDQQEQKKKVGYAPYVALLALLMIVAFSAGSYSNEHAVSYLAASSDTLLSIITGFLSMAYPSIIRGILEKFDPIELGGEIVKTVVLQIPNCSANLSVEFGMVSIAGLSTLDFDGLDLVEGSMTNEGSTFRPNWKFQGTWNEKATLRSLSTGTDASLDGTAECFNQTLSKKLSGTTVVKDSSVSIAISMEGGLQIGFSPSMTVTSARIESIELGIGTFDVGLEFSTWEEVAFDFQKSFEISISDDINEVINGINEKLNEGIEKALPLSLP